MRTPNIFPFTRDGYRYEIKPPFGDVLTFHCSIMYGGYVQIYANVHALPILLEVRGKDQAHAETLMQDMIHQVGGFIRFGEDHGLLNGKGLNLQDDFYRILNITNP
jgi:hypothetical protein